MSDFCLCCSFSFGFVHFLFIKKSYLETSLTRFNAKDCSFKAAICRLMNMVCLLLLYLSLLFSPTFLSLSVPTSNFQLFFSPGAFWSLQDADSVRPKWNQYKQSDPNLGNTFEETLILKLCEAVENGDEEQFSDAVAEYDRVHRLDPWKTQMLLKFVMGFFLFSLFVLFILFLFLFSSLLIRSLG